MVHPREDICCSNDTAGRSEGQRRALPPWSPGSGPLPGNGAEFVESRPVRPWGEAGSFGVRLAPMTNREKVDHARISSRTDMGSPMNSSLLGQHDDVVVPHGCVDSALLAASTVLGEIALTT